MRHTPGPWRFVAEYGRIESGQGRGRIKRNQPLRSFVAYISGRARVFGADVLTESHYNGILIAAAPEMLEALEAISEAFYRESLVEHRGDLMPKVWAAIRKARGEQ